MNTDMKKQIMKLLETYPVRERQIALLHYEMQHSARVSPEEVSDSMALGHGNGMGGSGKGHISNKTMYIALNYQEQMEHMNAEAADEIAQRLLELEEKQDRLRYYVSLLKPRQAEVIRRTFFKPESQEETAKALKISVRTVQTVKGQAIEAIVELYRFTEELR